MPEIMLWRGVHFEWANYVIFAAYFMLRGHDTHIIVSGRHDWWFALCKSSFFDLFWHVKFFIAAK